MSLSASCNGIEDSEGEFGVIVKRAGGRGEREVGKAQKTQLFTLWSHRNRDADRSMASREDYFYNSGCKTRVVETSRERVLV